MKKQCDIFKFSVESITQEWCHFSMQLDFSALKIIFAKVLSRSSWLAKTQLKTQKIFLSNP